MKGLFRRNHSFEIRAEKKGGLDLYASKILVVNQFSK